jgi:hypothetical protein
MLRSIHSEMIHDAYMYDYIYVYIYLSAYLSRNHLSTYLQPTFDLITGKEMHQLLTGSFGYGPPSAALLCRHATYDPAIYSDDRHIMVSNK